MAREVLFTHEVMPDAFGRYPWAQVVTLHEDITFLHAVGTATGAVVVGYSAPPSAEPHDFVLYLVAPASPVPETVEVDYLGAVQPGSADVLHAWIEPATDEALRGIPPLA